MPSPVELIASTYNPEARYSTKRRAEWVGHKVQLTETLAAATPNRMVNVETTLATAPDDTVIAV
jgi:transposase